ncbi:tRNA (guanosine(46)-N7)-methyltransferase TrmB [Propionibacteriaceae bacterium G1746]
MPHTDDHIDDPKEQRVHREVVSFVRRSARMNPSQQKAWERWSPTRVVPVETRETSTSVAPQPVPDWDAIFGRHAPIVVEIGSGQGDSLVPMAKARPEVNVVAFEVFEPSVASTLSKLAREDVDNVRIVIADGAQGLDLLFEPGQVVELWTFFADPWHKARHHKRRLVNDDLAATVVRQLAPGGHWHLATDWADYADWMREVLDQAPGLRNVHAGSGGWAPRWDARPLTKYERRGIEAGRDIHDLTYVVDGGDA